MKKVLLTTSLVAMMSATSVMADGKALYTSLGCVACHGNAGISSNPIYPNLAGQQATYIVKQLKDFQSGARKDPTMSAMAPMAAGKEQAIADYLTSLK